MKPTSFKFDEKTLELLDNLKGDKNGRTRSEVIRRALALYRIADQADEVVIKSHGKEKLVML